MEMEKDKLIELIVDLEWHAFQHVQNEGGRASCQDDKVTFYIMRKSQYMCWPDVLLQSYLKDFVDANSRQWNMVAEKYARMEEYTDPLHYQHLKPLLPEQTPEQIELINSIVKTESSWAEAFYEANPHVAGRSRAVHSDPTGFTSSSAYLKGELGTYSINTLRLYALWIKELKENGVNLVEEIVRNTFRLYKENAQS